MSLAEHIEELHSLLYERNETPGSELNWRDDDRSAPKTPWGPAQGGYVIAKDVIFYSTAGHGGLRVGASAAKKLSDAARALGDNWGGAYWYEEDSAVTLPMYEVPAWREAASKWFKFSDASLLKSLQMYYPKYLAAKGE
jgi:hypothetical protein